VLAAVAFCPAPPMLVPEVASGAAEELAGLRLACDQAVEALIGAHPDEIAILGAGGTTREHPPDAAGSLRGFGVDVRTGDGDPVLPPALTLGGWLLDRAVSAAPQVAQPAQGWPRRAMVEVAAGTTGDEAVLLGRQLASRPARTALLVMGDGATGRTPRAPGPFDRRAEAWDDAVCELLARGDADGMAGLDEQLARELGASGLPVWHTAAAAVRAPGGLASPHGTVLAYEAPYGVGYVVATWLPG
jgi:hypothetical protein